MSAKLILDVGSGHNPHAKATYLTDLYLGPTEHRGHIWFLSAVIDARPFVCSDIQHLPFRDKVFEGVICRQVLEHIDNPEQALQELQRVGKHGFVSVPSTTWERYFHSCAGHKWILKISGTHITKQSVLEGWVGRLRKKSTAFFRINFHLRARTKLVQFGRKYLGINLQYQRIRW